MNEPSLGDGLSYASLVSRAAELGIDLPAPPTPKGSYVPAVLHRGLVYTSGMGPMLKGVRHHSGYVGADISVAEAREAAGIAVVNALTAAIDVVDGIAHIERVVKLTGYVRSAPGFTEQPAVVDGASELLEKLLGRRGVHARSAVGVAELPFGISVEIELIVACRA